MRFLGFIGPSYTLNSVNVDCQRCVNLYPELDEIGTGKDKEVAWLQPTPGLRLLATLGAGPIRGSWTASNGNLYVVSGNTLYQVSSSWVGTSLGTLNTLSGRVSMADNGYQLAIVDGGSKAYIWDFTLLTFTQVSLPAVTNPLTLVSYGPGATQIIYQDSYFVLNVINSQAFNISGQYVATFNALDFALSTANPNNLISMISANENLWLFGANSIAIFYNSGNVIEVNGSPQAAFPFTPQQGAFIEIGCAAAFSVAKLNQTVFWLGQDDKGNGIVYEASGFQPVRVSTSAVESAIKTYGDISGATAYTYQSEGHNFYCLNFPNAKTTWVFDAATKLWHERVYTNQGLFERHRAETHSFAFNTHVVGDYQNGNIYALDDSVMYDNGNAITRQRASPHISTDMVRQFFRDFQLDMEPGVGIDGTGQGTNPQAILQWSDDGGHTWSNEKWTTIGAIGQTKNRAIWRRLGQGRNRVFRVTITDPVKVAMIGAELNYEPGMS